MADTLSLTANIAQVATFFGISGLAAFKIIKRVRLKVVILPEDNSRD